MHVIALMNAYNEERFIGACVEHLLAHGVFPYVIDNSSSDKTRDLLERYRASGALDFEVFPRDGVYRLRALLERKQVLAHQLHADWFVNVDPDEFHLPPRGSSRLLDAITDIDREGYNAASLHEFTFVPTQEQPEHDHAFFQQTMRWYYPFHPPWQHVRLWKRQHTPVDLVSSAGHFVQFAGIRLCPEGFRMRHYQFLSIEHAIRKYTYRRFDANAVATGWHGWRATLTPSAIRLPSQTLLRYYSSDADLDSSEPWICHYLG